jgi:hypothetical protein
MAVHYEQQGSVSVPVTASGSGAEHRFDLGWSEILTGPGAIYSVAVQDWSF